MILDPTVIVASAVVLATLLLAWLAGEIRAGRYRKK